MSNPNYNELYKKRMREIYEDINREKYYKENGYVTRNGRVISLLIVCGMLSLGYLSKTCTNINKDKPIVKDSLEYKIKVE